MNATTLDIELLRALWACYEYWRTGMSPPHERLVCYSHAEWKYSQKFGGKFHQSKLAALAKLGFLQPAHSVRGGGRRYYTIPDPDAVREVVADVG